MTARQLDLVSFVSHRHGDSLLVALRNLGYEMLPARWDTWLQAHTDGPSKPTVLFVTDGNYPREELVSVLGKTPQPQVLGVFSCKDSNWDEDLLRCCVDFLGWPCHQGELALRLQRAFGDAQSQSEDLDETVLLDEFVNLNMLGESPAFVEALKLIKRFARSDAPVLLEGETGTGKEIAARAIHYLGARRDYPFVAVNCGAIPDNLIENELFGHEQGAFTDARERRLGIVAQARGGTLFLDEIDALSTKAQITLLRFLEHQEFRPLGSKRACKTDVRIISATNAGLDPLALKGLFRQDLLFRLRVLFLQLPPLRERGTDIALLAEHFIRQYNVRYRLPPKSLHPDTVEWLMCRSWRGNVRELENLLHREFLLTDGPVVHVSQPGLQSNDPCTCLDHGERFFQNQSFKQAKAKAVAVFERRYLSWLMAETGGNISLAARQAGKDRSAFRRLLHKYGIRRIT
jgi:DNA-binding NtrC family response regulator